MFRKDPHPVMVPPPPEDLRFTDHSVPDRSCCCPARPVVKVIMPPTASRAQPVELWLCGHHYRASLAALHAAGATTEELTAMAGRLLPGHVAGPRARAR
jgi:hypothetical protein